MGTLSVTARNKLINHIFNTAYSQPSAVYLCLCTANPTENGEGDDMNETADAVGGYARQAITFSAASSRKIIQSGQVTFPKVTATYGAEIKYWAICSSDIYGGGDMLAFGEFATYFTPIINNVYYIKTEEIEISIEEDADYGFTDYAVHLMLDMMFRHQEWSTPKDGLYIALFTYAIAHDVSNTSELSEETGATDYARVNVTGWSNASGGETENEADITMVASISIADWGSDVASAIVLAASGPTQVLCYDNLSIPEQYPTTGDEIKFDAGDFIVALY